MDYTLLKNLPPRDKKPRNQGLTIVLDKGMSVREVENFVSVAAEYADFVKFGWSTALFTPHLKRKLALYKSAHIIPFLGGTLFEAFLIRQQLRDYEKMLLEYDITHVEISDGSISIQHEKKCDYINQFSKKFTVLSEVGSKDAQKVITVQSWLNMLQTELASGASYVICEAREGGNAGIFKIDNTPKVDLIEKITESIPYKKVIWESPKKAQQVFFIKKLGTNVNLGNIPSQEIIPLETLRLGLRGDTFSTFL